MKYAICTLFTLIAFASCKKNADQQPAPPPSESKPRLLKNVVFTNLPSPYYHFEYDAAGKIVKTSHESGMRMYDLLYNNDRLTEMRNNTAVNKDRLQYAYNALGQAELVTYRNEAGTVFRLCSLTYNQLGQLITIEWEIRIDIGFAVERTVQLEYLPDGNVSRITDHHFHVLARPEKTQITTFEQYDAGISVEGFSLIQDDNDHLLLLPTVKIQKNNPLKVIRTGTGVNYNISYSYSYDMLNMPVAKVGDAVITSGPNAGQHWTASASYSYY